MNTCHPTFAISSGKQFLVLKENPQHPSLQFKKIGDRLGQEVWSARVTLNDRAVAIKRLRDYLWFWIGDHKAYEHLIFIAKTRSSN